MAQHGSHRNENARSLPKRWCRPPAYSAACLSFLWVTREPFPARWLNASRLALLRACATSLQSQDLEALVSTSTPGRWSGLLIIEKFILMKIPLNTNHWNEYMLIQTIHISLYIPILTNLNSSIWLVLDHYWSVPCL